MAKVRDHGRTGVCADRGLGLIHVKLQTWFPMQLEVYVNGHEWLARKLTRSGVPCTQQDNVFLRVGDLARAQRLADRFASGDRVRRLDRCAHAVHPLLAGRLAPLRYSWVTAQAEDPTDILFTSRRQLQELRPSLLEHSTLHRPPPGLPGQAPPERGELDQDA